MNGWRRKRSRDLAAQRELCLELGKQKDKYR